MKAEILEILDIVYSDYPNEPDWAAVKTFIYQCADPVQVQLELIKVMWLYAEDPAAFEELIRLEQSQ